MPRGFLQVMTAQEVDSAELAALDAAKPEIPEETSELAGFVRRQFEVMRRHRTQTGLDNRLLAAMRMYKGEYDPKKFAEITQFGGSTTYSRIAAVKCRGATAILRDVYLGNDRVWGIDPTPVPELPDDIMGSIDALVGIEAVSMAQAGQPVDPQAMQARRELLIDAATQAAKRTAAKEAREEEDVLQDKLVEGGFRKAMRDFLVQLPMFPYAAIKGPVVEMADQVTWLQSPVGAIATIERKPKMTWSCVDPTFLYFSPGATCIDNADIIERKRVRRSDLNALIGLPGYDEKAIRSALSDYDTGNIEHWDGIDSTMADAQGKEIPSWNESHLIDTLEYHGAVKGSTLLEYGFSEAQISDEDLDYHVQVWLVGRYVIKAQLNPNPRQRAPYYVTSFETLPHSMVGMSLSEGIAYITDSANAALRALNNNMSIASGPQVAINESRLAPNTNPDSLYPWKRWRFLSDPLAVSGERPIDFFQPQSNAQELLGIYEKMTIIADETSGIPRFITGQSKGAGGAAGTAAGLSMLMNNASKILQTIAGNIDEDVLDPLVRTMHSICLLTDTSGKLRGDAKIVVRGATVAQQRESERMRQLEFLQITANPIDMEITGKEGRAAILRHLAHNLGIPGEKAVPDAAQQPQGQPAEMQLQGGSPQQALPAGGGRIGEETDNMQRTRNFAQAPNGRPPGS